MAEKNCRRRRDDRRHLLDATARWRPLLSLIPLVLPTFVSSGGGSMVCAFSAAVPRRAGAGWYPQGHRPVSSASASACRDCGSMAVKATAPAACVSSVCSLSREGCFYQQARPQYRSDRPRAGFSAMGAGKGAQDDRDPVSNDGGRGSSSVETPSPRGREGDSVLSPVLIKVVGVGGGGGNAVDGMMTTATRKLAGVEFIAMNTDTQALTRSQAEHKIALGTDVTRGLGAGGKPEVGRAAALESLPEIEEALRGADMVFVTAGMGGGTGTGAAPVIAAAAREMGCLTVAVVTEPFEFEGRQRSRQAAVGVADLRQCSDTVLVVDNNRLLEIVPERMTMSDAFLVADDVLRQGVIGTSEIIVRPGLINVDFADVREVVRNSGTALIGIGTGTGETRAEDAAVGAMCSPLLDYPLNQAAGVIFNIIGGIDLSLTEVNAAARIIQANVHADANIIVGALVDERCGDQVSVTVLATGFEVTEAEDVNRHFAARGAFPISSEGRSNSAMGEGGARNAGSQNPGAYEEQHAGVPISAGEASSPKKGGFFRRLFREK